MLQIVKFALGAGFVAYLAAGALSKNAETLTTDAPSQSFQPAKKPDGRGGSVTLFANQRGHFVTPIKVEGVEINALVDTGATMLALSYEDAQRANIKPPSNARTAIANTANGPVPYTVMRFNEVRLNGITVYGVDGAIMPKGALTGTLLGMSFLKKLSKVAMQNGRLDLAQ